MRQTRLYIDAGCASGSEVQLDAERARYLGRVLRLRAGDSVLVFDGSGKEFEATLSRIGKSGAVLSVGEASMPARESSLKLHLVQGISRGERMDFVVQKATELGVKRITPVLTEHGVVKLDAERAEKRRAHWQKVATSACEQCGRVRLPLVDAPVPLNEWFGQSPSSADIDLILTPGAPSSLNSIAAPVTKICILIGPEGGFSDSEYDNAAIAGFRPVSLGARILRTETAAVAALALLQARWGDLG
ncbi:MAG: 16S rRNA (uracil(1498)-N(3))-methyltransferase [Gammaproteobacteria bacterium]|nr:16S rRNA (uracil(1498)-N(3))-methyltransferase [Gammaproteobacteria bacterium]